MSRAIIPDHVPAHLVWDHDIEQFPKQFENPFVGASDALHEGPDIIWSPRNAQFGRPGWIITRRNLQEEIYLDAVRFPAAASGGLTAIIGKDVALIPLESDPPMHRHYRQLLQPFFTPSAVKAHDPMIRDICRSLIDAFADRKRVDFVAEFSSLLPSHIFLHMFGLPIDMLPQFLKWEHGFLGRDGLEAQFTATREIYEYLKESCERKRQEPADDLMSKIVHAEVDGRPLTEDEVDGMCFTLFGGGLDTVSNSLGVKMWHLARDVELQARLRDDPDLFPAAIEELLRAYPVTNNSRTVGMDLEFHGVKMRKGDRVALTNVLAARDPQAYDQPHAIDIDRKVRNTSFGTGVHNCLGIHLARRELRIAFEELFARMKNFRIVAGSQPEFDFTPTWGVKSLVLEWE